MIEVRRPGMTALWMRCRRYSAMNGPVCQVGMKAVKTRNGLSLPPFPMMCDIQISLIHLIIKSSSIHAFGCVAITNPYGYLKFWVWCSVFPLKMTIGARNTKDNSDVPLLLSCCSDLDGLPPYSNYLAMDHVKEDRCLIHVPQEAVKEHKLL